MTSTAALINRIARWVREELRLIGLDSWAEGEYHGPPDPHPCTSSDPRCARLAERQDALYKSMRRVKSHVLDRKADDALEMHRNTDVRATMARAQAVSKPAVRLVRRVRG